MTQLHETDNTCGDVLPQEESHIHPRLQAHRRRSHHRYRRCEPPDCTQPALEYLCGQATSLGNNISFQLVELLTEARHPHNPSLRTLAKQYLEICRMIFFIEAGLAQSQSSPARSPENSPAVRVFRADMVRGLELRLRQVVGDFHSLSDVLQTYLDIGKKGRLAIISCAVRRALADRDLERLRADFQRSVDALRAAALVFQWSLGRSVGESAIGMSYADVVAALRGAGAKRPGMAGRATTVCVARLMGSNVRPKTLNRCETLDERMTSASDGDAELRDDMTMDLCRRSASFSMAMPPCA